MLRTANNEFIEVEDVEVERQAKIFQAIGDTAGDFSYEFNIDNNTENLAKLNILSPVDGFQKSIYTVSDIDLCDNDRGVLYKGFVRVSGIDDDNISVSFFSGNNNWFNMMSGEIADLDLTSLQLEINPANIAASWANTSGIIFPFVDLGSISRRSTNNWKIDDFQPFIYVKDAVLECFKQSGLKLSGEILDDWRYNHLITTNGSDNTDEIEDRKVSVAKSSPQSISEATWDVVTFPDFTGVNYPGTLWDTTNSKFVADCKMIVDVSFNVIVDVTGSSPPNYLILHFYVNGVFKKFAAYEDPGLNQRIAHSDTLYLEEGDELELRARRTQPSDTAAVESGSIKIVPTRLYKVFANNLLPNTSQVDFVSEVFMLFNTVADYDPFTKTVTVDFFKNVIRREEIDLSEYIDPSTVKIDYTELIETYGKMNVLKYADPSSESIGRYNKDKVYPYGAGAISSDNEFVEEKVNIIESVFCASDMAIKNPFSVLLPRMDFTEEEDGSEFTATITNSAGSLFTVDATFKPVVNDLVNIVTSTNDVYGGQYMIFSVVSPTTFRVTGLHYVSNETVTITKTTISRNNNNDQILLLVEPDVPFSEFAPDITDVDIEDTNTAEDPAIAWFYRPMDGNTVDNLDKSLAFDSIPIENAFQRTMIEDYWADLGPILQDPVKPYIDSYLPKAVFESITFKQPLRIKCDQFNSRFYPNRITGYKDSSQPCTLELIKLP